MTGAVRQGPIRAGIIGAGGMARAHARAFRELPDDVEFVACAHKDIGKARAFATEWDVSGVYRHAAEMVRDARLDLVSVCTPPYLHGAISIACLEAGAWVLCEKPLCGSLAEMDAIEAAERRGGGYASSVFQWRFGTGARHLKKLVDNGTLGRPLVGVCQTTWFRDDTYYQVPWRGRWHTELGGPTVGHGIHAMDLLVWLLGDWSQAWSTMDTLARDIETEDVSMAVLRFENGAMATVVNSVVSPREETVLRLDFELATVEVRGVYTTAHRPAYSNADWSFVARGDQRDRLAPLLRLPDNEAAPSHEAQVRQVVQAMREGRRPPASGADARRTLELVAGLYKSAAAGEVVHRASLLPGDRFYQVGFGAGWRAERGEE